MTSLFILIAESLGIRGPQPKDITTYDSTPDLPKKPCSYVNSVLTWRLPARIMFLNHDMC